MLWCSAIQRAVEFRAFDIRGGWTTFRRSVRSPGQYVYIRDAEQRPATALEKNTWVVQVASEGAHVIRPKMGRHLLG